MKRIIHRIVFPFICSVAFFFASAQEGQKSKMLAGYTAKPLQQGQGYLQNIDGLIWQAEIGISSNWSIGAGSSFIPFINANNTGGIKTKVAFPINDDMHFGLGTYFFFPGYEDVLIIPTLLFSFEAHQNQFTFGWSPYTKNINDNFNWGTTFNFGAVFPIFKNGYLVSENWVQLFGNIYTDLGFFFFPSLAVRWNVKRFSFELGILGLTGNDGDGGGGIPFPHGGISYFF
jgi:hypothetical protein